EDLGRADPRAGAAEDVLLEDVLCRAAHVVRGDLADEARDVDAGGAGLDAGRVVAEVAAAGLDQSRLAVERRMHVGEGRRVGGVRQTPGTDVRLVSHRDLPDRPAAAALRQLASSMSKTVALT